MLKLFLNLMTDYHFTSQVYQVTGKPRENFPWNLGWRNYDMSWLHFNSNNFVKRTSWHSDVHKQRTSSLPLHAVGCCALLAHIGAGYHSGLWRRRTASPKWRNRRKNLHVPQGFSDYCRWQGAEGLALRQPWFVLLRGIWRRQADQAPAEGAERQRFGLLYSLRYLVRWKGDWKKRMCINFLTTVFFH